MTQHQQLHSIHQLIDDGRQGLLLESHSLPLICVTVGLIIGFSGELFRFLLPHNPNAVYAELVFISVLTASVLYLDRRITRRKRSGRGEVVSLLYKKVGQIIWGIIGVAILLTIYIIHDVGPGKLVLWFCLFVFGLCLYVLGLFSRRWYTLNGVVLIALGAGALVFVEPNTGLRIFTTAVFICGGIGIQAFSGYATSNLRALVGVSAWLGTALIATLAAQQLYYRWYISADHLPRYSLAQYQQIMPAEKAVLSAPAGSKVHVESTVYLPVFTEPATHTLEMELAKPVELVVQNGRLGGLIRIDKGDWLELRDAFKRRGWRRDNILTAADGPRIERHEKLAIEYRFWD